jgi:hypothetical protein
MPTRGALRMRARVRELFPPDDPIVPCLLRLMAAANDLGALGRLFLQSSSRAGGSESEKKIVEAENVYLFRITSATVYETAKVFLDFESQVRKTEKVQKKNLITSLDKRGRDAFLFLENVFRHDIGKFEKTEYGKILVQARHHSFHYDTIENFREALKKHDEVGELIIGEISGITRYLLADDLQVQITLRPIGIDLKTVAETLKAHAFVETTARLAASPTSLVDAWIKSYSQKNPKALVEMTKDKVLEERLWTIDPSLFKS